ncbi:DUF2182 domain-containing protein [bacterium]|nr:MAG: DUF2182 domain-containing protein [bacterium]
MTSVRRAAGVPLVIPGAIAAAWALAVIAQYTGTARLLHHDALAEGSLHTWAALGLFSLAWQAMIAAMMLPTTLPLVRLFSAASTQQPRPGVVLFVLLLGYAAVWTLFGALAFLGDVALHRFVDRAPWLQAHAWLIAGGTLVLAGAFQFTPLKDACLTKCRLPGTYLMQRYRRGAAAAFRIGSEHGLTCVGCCWALMLLMFAAGVAHLWWMAALTAIMVYEKVAPRGRQAVPVAGVLLLTWGLLVALHPSWLPAPLAGVF